MRKPDDTALAPPKQGAAEQRTPTQRTRQTDANGAKAPAASAPKPAKTNGKARTALGQPMAAEQPVARPICGAKRPGKDAICQSTVLSPNGRCMKHGGMTPSGINSPHWKTGEHVRNRYQRSLAKVPSLAAKAEAVLNDPARLELTSEMAILGGMIGECIERLSTSENGELWTSLVKAREEFRQAQRIKAEAKKRQAIGAAMEKMLDLIDRGGDAFAARAELVTMLDNYRKLAESERKRHVEMHDVVTSEMTVILLSKIVSIVHEFVTDRAARASMAERILSLATQPQMRPASDADGA